MSPHTRPEVDVEAIRERLDALPYADEYGFEVADGLVEAGEHRLVRTSVRDSPIADVYVCGHCCKTFLTVEGARDRDDGRCGV